MYQQNERRRPRDGNFKPRYRGYNNPSSKNDVFPNTQLCVPFSKYNYVDPFNLNKPRPKKDNNRWFGIRPSTPRALPLFVKTYNTSIDAASDVSLSGRTGHRTHRNERRKYTHQPKASEDDRYDTYRKHGLRFKTNDEIEEKKYRRLRIREDYPYEYANEPYSNPWERNDTPDTLEGYPFEYENESYQDRSELIDTPNALNRLENRTPRDERRNHSFEQSESDEEWSWQFQDCREGELSEQVLIMEEECCGPRRVRRLAAWSGGLRLRENEQRSEHRREHRIDQKRHKH